MIQMDASSYKWINNHLWHPHPAVDDATGEVIGAHFDTQKTLKRVLSDIKELCHSCLLLY